MALGGTVHEPSRAGSSNSEPPPERPGSVPGISPPPPFLAHQYPSGTPSACATQRDVDLRRRQTPAREII
jgi:hypothetical protein